MSSDTPKQNPVLGPTVLGQGETKTLGMLSSLIAEFSTSLDLDQTMKHVVEVTKATNLVVCESCQRILYKTETLAAKPAGEAQA